MNSALTSRRVALHVIATSMAMPMVGCAMDPMPTEPEPFGDVSAGNVADTPENTLRAVAGAPAIIGRDSRGLYAMTSTCTHQGCDMIADGRVDANGVACGCHNSRFDRNGAVKSGPATGPLQHFAVSVDATGLITVHGGEPVDASKRTAVA